MNSPGSGAAPDSLADTGRARATREALPLRIWMITSLELRRGEWLRASTIQNLQTALALADLGHDITLWVETQSDEGLAEALAVLGRASAPAGLRLLAATPRGARGDKRTPFATPAPRLLNLARGRLAAGAWPDAILTRSPMLLGQLRGMRARAASGLDAGAAAARNRWPLPAATRLVLEYQYPEWAQLWRGWSRRRDRAAELGGCAGLQAAKAELRRLRRREDACLQLADGVLYAARAHEPLLRRAGFGGRSALLRSACPEPDRALAREPCEFDFGFLGNLAPENGFETLLEALARLPGARLLAIVTGGECAIDGARGSVTRLGLAHRVTFAARVPFREVRGWQRRCAIGVVPLSARHGAEKRQYASPLKLIEWMAAGVPLIAGAVPSVLGITGSAAEPLFVPCKPDDPRALAETMAALRDDALRRAALARAGLAEAAACAYPRRAGFMADFFAGLLYYESR